MKTNKTFVEEELEREKRLRENPDTKFSSILEVAKKIFGRGFNQSVEVGKTLNAALSASKYGIDYPTISDKPQMLYSGHELSGEEARKYLNTIILQTNR